MRDEEISCGKLFGLAADVLADEGDETAFGTLSKLVVVGCFLAHYEASAVVARVEPYRRRGGGPAGAVKSHTRAHFDEGPPLRKFCRFLVLDPDQGEPLIVLEDADGTDRDFVASFGLADGPPVPGGEDYQADYEHRCQHDGSKNDEGFFQCCLVGTDCNETLSSKKPFLSTGDRTLRSRSSVLVLWLWRPVFQVRAA